MMMTNAALRRCQMRKYPPRLKDGELARLDNKHIDLDKVVALAESLKPDPIANYAG